MCVRHSNGREIGDYVHCIFAVEDDWYPKDGAGWPICVLKLVASLDNY